MRWVSAFGKYVAMVDLTRGISVWSTVRTASQMSSTLAGSVVDKERQHVSKTGWLADPGAQHAYLGKPSPDPVAAVSDLRWQGAWRHG